MTAEQTWTTRQAATAALKVLAKMPAQLADRAHVMLTPSEGVQVHALSPYRVTVEQHLAVLVRLAGRLSGTTEWVTREGDRNSYPWQFTVRATVAGVPVEVYTLYSQQQYDDLCADNFTAVG